MQKSAFSGFPAGKVHLTRIPSSFFSEILPEMDDLNELKIILYTIWFLEQQEGETRYITLQDFLNDKKLISSLGNEPEALLYGALDKAVNRNVLLKAYSQNTRFPEIAVYFLNTPRGRAAVKAIENNSWTPDIASHLPVSLEIERPNIFKLYEENIGPLTPIIADTLREAEETYKVEWIKKAIKIAVQKNVRNWRYVEAILNSWLEEGYYEKDRRNSEEDRRKYLDDDYSDIIQH